VGRERLLVRASLSALLALAVPGCAISERENRRTLNALDEHATPASAAARWALSPLALPASLVAVAGDAMIVHPICSIDDAWADTVDALWTSHGETKFRRAVMLPLAAVATPFFFTGDVVARALFPIDANGRLEP
jgi:hypothetical protein